MYIFDTTSLIFVCSCSMMWFCKKTSSVFSFEFSSNSLHNQPLGVVSVRFSLTFGEGGEIPLSPHQGTTAGGALPQTIPSRWWKGSKKNNNNNLEKTCFLCKQVVCIPICVDLFGVRLTAKHNPTPSPHPVPTHFFSLRGRWSGERQSREREDGPSLTAALILLLFLLCTRIFGAFSKVFLSPHPTQPTHTHSPFLPPPPLLFFLPFFPSRHSRPVIGCCDRAIGGLSASSKAPFNYCFSPTWHKEGVCKHTRTHAHGCKNSKRWGVEIKNTSQTDGLLLDLCLLSGPLENIL